jgi:RNA polymerase-binding transcription factor DksA
MSLHDHRRYMLALAEDLHRRLREQPSQPTVLIAGDAVDTTLVNHARGHFTLARARMQERFTNLIAALRRIEAGSYGVCVGCASPIAEARLTLMPETELCFACAMTEERAVDALDATLTERSQEAPDGRA